MITTDDFVEMVRLMREAQDAYVWIPRCARWLRRLDSEPGLFGPDAR